MKIRELVHDTAYDWQGNAPATKDAISDLKRWAPVDLPKDYLDFLRVTDGGEGEFSCYPGYVRVWPAATVIDFNEGYEIQKWLPEFIGIGDNGGCDFVAFDMRSGDPFPLKAFLFSSMDLAYAISVAENFSEFIQSLKRKDPD
jgi:hypothetical protein